MFLRTLVLILLAWLPSFAATNKPHLFLVGDSIMGHYRPLLTELLPPNWQVDGKSDSGEAPPAAHNLDVPTGGNAGDSAMVVSYLKARLAKHPIQADALLINCGLHDIKTDVGTGKRQVELRQYAENLDEIIKLAQSMKLRVVWVRTTPVVDAVHNRKGAPFYRYASDVQMYNETADAVMVRHQVPIIDLFIVTSHFIPNAYIDHVHYSPAIREIQAAFIAGSLRALSVSW